MLLVDAARPSIPELPHDWLELSLGSSLAEYSRPNCSAGWNGALIPIKRTGFLPDCIALNFITPFISSHNPEADTKCATIRAIKYGGFT